MFPLPTQIGRYEIKSLIERGGMGDLYLAHDPNTNRLVALKLLNATLDSSELRQRFVREARALAALNHPNIVNIYDTGEFEGSPFIVMEYVRGETLAEMIKRRAPVSVSQKLKLMTEVCAGLAQAHDAGIIHRDIKPANLIVDQQGRLKILDFGIARVAEDNRTRAGLPLTQANMLIGTPGYMSPEQIEGGEADHRSDIFAVGAVCYELLSYSEAFSGPNTRQIERRVLRGKPAPLASLVPGLDPEIDEVVLRALKSDPNKRYQDAATFEKALERLRSRLGPDAQGPPPRPTPPPPPNARGKSREVRAEAACQRSLAAYRRGALDAARRFAVEALAEDPSHEGARALLARLEPRAPLTEASPSASPEPAPPTVERTSVSEAPPTIASAPTILVTPTDARTSAARKRYQTVWSSGGPFRRLYERLWKRDSASSRRHDPLWLRYGLAAQAIGLLVIVATIVAAVSGLSRWLRPSGQLLTITKPIGGTISAAGIRCGSGGTDCTATRPNGDSIELRPEADAGFAFVGYTGVCAPGGRIIMTAPRVCGATFAPVETVPPAVTQLLTIAPVPMGGTLEGVDIKCGTKGSVCSVNHLDGVVVDLYAMADPGFTFMGFLGECKPLGHTKMTGPRTCSATFSPTPPTTTTVPAVKIAPSGPPVRRGGGVAPPPPPNDSPTGAPNNQLPPIGNVDPLAPVGPKEVLPPITDEEFAKGKIRELLKKHCDAYEALDPAAVQRVEPKVDMKQLERSLNKSGYKSVQCKFEDPEFLALDPSKGTAKVKAGLKRVFEHTAGSEKPDIKEQTAEMTLSRPGPRSPWQIDTVTYREKKK